MPTTKLIYGVGRIPKASEFALGEIIVNVDDSKVFSKSKSNVVFEIGGGGNNTTNNITEGDTITNISGFNTASISSSGFFTSADTSNLIISGGTGVIVTTGSNNQIIITATGEAEATIVNAETASYVEVAQTSSYVNTSNLDGNLFQLSNDGDQGGIIFSENNIDIYSNVNAIATGLGKTDSVVFAQVSSSGLLFASASEEITGGNNIRTVVYDTASGRFYFTGSYGGGGSSTSTLQQVTDQGSSTTTAITSSIISASGDVFVKRLRLSSGTDTTVSGIIFDEQAGNSGFIHDDGQSMHLGYNDTDIISVSSSNEFKLLVNGGTRIASGRLQVQGNITASNPDGISNQGNISASGLLFASASQPAAHAGSIVAVVYDTSSGQFYYTGSYGAGGSGADNDWFIDTANSRLTSSLDVLFEDYLGGPTLFVSTSGVVNIGTESTPDLGGAGNILNVEGTAYIKDNLRLGDAAGSSKIEFNRDVAAVSVSTAEVSMLGGNGSYKQSLNFFNSSTTRAITLDIGNNQYFKANFTNGARADKYFLINGDDDNIDFIVSGSNFPNLLVAAVDSDNVGVGYGSSSLSATYGDYKLAVSGNLYNDGYLTLASKENTTGVAGALLYSSSNEFYLGFS